MGHCSRLSALAIATGTNDGEQRECGGISTCSIIPNIDDPPRTLEQPTTVYPAPSATGQSEVRAPALCIDLKTNLICDDPASPFGDEPHKEKFGLAGKIALS